MKTVYKYPLEVKGAQKVSLPMGARILSVMNQREEIVLYAYVDPEQTETEDWHVFVLATGEPRGMHPEAEFLGTVAMMDGSLMFHVFVWHPEGAPEKRE